MIPDLTGTASLNLILPCGCDWSCGVCMQCKDRIGHHLYKKGKITLDNWEYREGWWEDRKEELNPDVP